MHGFVIGLDLGTSGVRAVAVDASGKILALGSATLPATKATGARREQSPEDWWNGCRTALDELSLKLDLSAARAIAVGGEVELQAEFVEGRTTTVPPIFRRLLPSGPRGLRRRKCRRA